MRLLNSGTFLTAEDAKRYWVLGDLISLQTFQGPTGEHYGLGETICAPGGGPPPHLHRNEDEAFYIVEGNFEFLLGDKIVSAPRGSFVYAPRNKVHQFKNKGPGKGVFILWVQSAGFTRFLSEAGTAAEGIVDPPEIDQPMIDRLGRLCAAYGIEMHPEARATGMAQPAENKAYWVFGDRMKLLCTGAQSNNALCAVEVTSMPGGGPPAHTHSDADEIFYVIDGKFEFQLGDRKVIGERGAVVHVPKRIPHFYRNIGGSTGRLIFYHTPAGIEHFITECGTLEGSGRPSTLHDPKWIAAIARKQEMELVG